MSPPTLVMVAWLAYIDWVINPSLAAGALNAQFLDLLWFPCYYSALFGFLFATILPLCYNIELGHAEL